MEQGGGPLPPATDPSFNADSAPDDLRASIMAAYEGEPDPVTDSPESSDTTPSPASEPDAAAIDPLPEEAAASTIKSDHPSDPKRYADGSFKPTKPATEAAKTEPSKDTQTQASPAASTPASAPPAGWTAAEKATVWPTLSPAAQAAVSRRETDMANGGKQWSEEKRRYEAMIAPVAESARARGMNAEQGLQTLMAAQRALDTDPVSAIRHIARSYGVDLANLAGQAANGSPDQTQQPDIAALVRQAVAPMLAPLQQRYESEENARQQQTVDFVTQFATSPGHEHFESVQQELMAMIPSIRESNPTWGNDKVLQEAYDRATYANPTSRAVLMAAQETAAEAKRVEAAKTRAASARRAGSSVTGAPAGVPAVQAKDSLRAEIEAAYAGS